MTNRASEKENEWQVKVGEGKSVKVMSCAKMEMDQTIMVDDDHLGRCHFLFVLLLLTLYVEGNKKKVRYIGSISWERTKKKR